MKNECLYSSDLADLAKSSRGGQREERSEGGNMITIM